MSPALLLFVICAVTVVLFLVAAAKWKKDAAHNSEAELQQVGVTYPYVRKGALLTAAERSFLGVLEKIIGARYRIYAQVRLADVIAIRPGTDKRQRQMALNRITSKHIDFVICERFTLEVLCAIELDDSTHARDDRVARDQFVDAVLHTAELPLVRVVAKAGYQPDEIKKALEKVLGRFNSDGAEMAASLLLDIDRIPTPVEGKKLVLKKRGDPHQVQEVEQAFAATLAASAGSEVVAPALASVSPHATAVEPFANPEESPECPKCAGATVLRTVKSGARANSKLWGCVRYPSCRGMIPAPNQVAEQAAQ